MAGFIARPGRGGELGGERTESAGAGRAQGALGDGSGSVREVHERMCPGGELAFNTVQTLLRIMEDKGLIRHCAEGARLSMNRSMFVIR